MKRVLVTGATGFCGRHLSKALSSEGYSVLGTYRRPPAKSLQFDGQLFSLNIKDRQAIFDFIRHHPVDYVCHLAAQSVPRFSWELESETIEINTAGTIHLLEALRRYRPQTKVLFTSTNQVYGYLFRSKKSPVLESDPVWPENPYASSKATAELACLNFASQFGLEVIVARPFNHMGRWQADYFVFSDWCRQVALSEQGKRRPVLEVGNMDALRDFLHVQDVVNAYLILLRKGKSGEIYNVCTGKLIVLEKYIQFLVKKSKVPMTVEIQKKRLRRNDPPAMRGSWEKMRRLGWKPQHSAFDALEDMLNEWREKTADLN